MIFFASNRSTNTNKDLLFGDQFNSAGQDDLTFAEYSNNDNKITVTTSDQVLKKLKNSDKKCVVFVHGFNQSINKNLKKSKEIESYGFNVLAFSWPSNPGPNHIFGKIKEYKRANKNVFRSLVAYSRFFDRLESFILEKGVNPFSTLVVHSLGNYLTKNFINTDLYQGQLGIFKNILLHQADVDSVNHHLIFDKLTDKSKVLVTINVTDDVLDISDIINPNRLGNTARNLNSEKIEYYNFSKAKEANDSHRLWHLPASANDNIKEFFKVVFSGQPYDNDEVEYNTKFNYYIIK
ncbi:alpha/beta hydrolase [Flammeovirga sp. OC4]|uniref:alpha/beta hydrolase n=1 Tax=Flammeovirga sp. OC4 TaxID=1382345 RepID=UPI0005C6C06C|nr:alpha/beta hydrolase [Flammeovirga sp. OC4]